MQFKSSVEITLNVINFNTIISIEFQKQKGKIPTRSTTGDRMILHTAPLTKEHVISTRK